MTEWNGSMVFQVCMITLDIQNTIDTIPKKKPSQEVFGCPVVAVVANLCINCTKERADARSWQLQRRDQDRANGTKLLTNGQGFAEPPHPFICGCFNWMISILQ